MKKFLHASLLALCVAAAAGQDASAHPGNCTFSFGISWSCWRDFSFPCVDPALFGLPNGCGYGGGYAGYGQPAVYQAAPIYINAPAGSAAPATSTYYQPTWNYPGYQNAGYYPQPSFSNTPGTWYGYGY